MNCRPHRHKLDYLSRKTERLGAGAALRETRHNTRIRTEYSARLFVA